MTTEQQDVLCEITNSILFSLYLRFLQDQKVNPEKVVFTRRTFLILDLGTKYEDAMDFYPHLKNLLTP